MRRRNKMFDKEQAREKIKLLIDKYNHLSKTEISNYNEEKTKQVFIRPLFEALRWDFEEEVHPETKVSSGRVDYY
jgi:predicted type IV restriction endonuclease